MNTFNLYSAGYDWFMKRSGFYKPKAIIEQLKPQPVDVILDLAGGTGYISNQISKYASKVVVIDAAEKMLNRAKRYPHLELHLGDAINLPFADNSFDAVVCVDAMHHIKKIEEAVSEARRVLKPNGKIVIFEFNTIGFWGRAIKFFELTFIDNSRFLKPDELKEIMSNLNFSGKTVEVSRVEYIYVGHKCWKNENKIKKYGTSYKKIWTLFKSTNEKRPNYILLIIAIFVGLLIIIPQILNSIDNDPNNNPLPDTNIDIDWYNPPCSPEELSNDWKEITDPRMAQNSNRREFLYKSTNIKIAFDKGRIGAPKFRGKNHWHRYNPFTTNKHNKELFVTIHFLLFD